jgi:hypothetical protein
VNVDRISVRIGDKAVTLKLKGVSTLRVGTILGRVRLDDGRERIWVDRLLHEGGPITLSDGTTLSGAVSTIVTRPAALVD